MKALSYIIWFSLLAAAFGAPAGAETPVEFVVSYVSAEHVYLDAGEVDGLEVGDSLAVADDAHKVPVLEVVFVARHSASCRRLEASREIAVGDKLQLIGEQKASHIPPPQGTLEPLGDFNPLNWMRPSPIEPIPVPAPVRLYGNVTMTLYHWSDRSAAGLDFTQTSGRLNLRAENIWREHMTLAVRTRGRYDVRSRAYSTGGEETEWKNRLWVLSFEYDDPDATLGFTLGRFLPRRMGSIGYLEGGLVRAQLSGRFQSGLFVGRRPEWAYSDADVLSLSKYGGYLSYRSDGGATVYIDQAVGLVAESHNGDLSRSFLTWSGSIRRGGAFGVSQSVEIDVNSGWRKEKTSESVTISNLFLHTWYRFSRTARISFQYDNRQNYWTYEFQSIADSLFDSRVRQGVRARIDLSPFTHTWVSGSVGYRKTDGDDEANRSYSASVRRSGVLGYNLSMSLRLSGFTGAFENGTSYSVRAQLPPGKLGRAYVAVGGYSYSVDGQPDSRRSDSFEFGTSFDFGSGYYVGGSTEWNSGEDIDGFSLRTELGYRY